MDLTVNPSHTAQAQKQPIPKAIALISGGLDSALAAALVKSWGIEVIGLHLTSPFGCTTDAEKMTQEINIPLVIRDKGEAFIDLVEKPKYGYGSQINPCIDCRIYMFQLAEQTRLQLQADFIITGEVLGQRPLSQTKNAIGFIDRHSPTEDRIFRPLSAGNFPETLPEKKGWVSREHFLKLSGRGRTDQLALAQKLGIQQFSSPGGGCLLTEKAFAERLRDFFAHPTFNNAQEKQAQVAMLRLGRHFRLSPRAKVIVGRTDLESNELKQLWQHSGAYLWEPANFFGPVAIGLGIFEPQEKITATRLVARYGRKKSLSDYECLLWQQSPEGSLKSEKVICQKALEEEVLNPWRIGIT